MDIVLFGVFMVGITQVFKEIKVPTELLPLICVLLSSVLWMGIVGELSFVAGIEGALIGMSSTGLVSLGKDGLANIRK